MTASRARLLCLVAALTAFGGCKTAQVNPLIGPPPRPEAKAFVIPPDANFVLSAAEAVATAEEDQSAFVKIFIDGKEAGQTAIAPKSKEKKWGQVLPAGNHLFRFEEWVLPLPGEWTPLREGWQPPERFIRIESGLETYVALKFYDGGRQHTLEIVRQPLSAKP